MIRDDDIALAKVSVVRDPREMITPAHRAEFTAGPGYLNTAAVGLPPRVAMTAMRQCLAEWESGTCDPPAFDASVTRARTAFARIVGTQPNAVAMVGQVSAASGLVASNLPDGARVLCAEEDFTSVLFPFLADTRLDITVLPLEQLIARIDGSIDLVAVSAAQSADGRVLDLDHLADAARDAGARTYVDVTQAAGWLPVAAERFDVTSCGAYKWLCSPRGTGFLTVGPDSDWLTPRLSGWYSTEQPWESIYGPPLRLAADARRFDLSPPWFDMVAAAEAIELLAGIGVEAIGRHSVGLANRFRDRVGLPASNSAIVAIETNRGRALTGAGITASDRAGKVRLAFYLYNTAADADAAATALEP